ncbi:MAG TPA: long-chain fatty acid--CoA ligase [Solirubrobacteraceae bacterium]|jgi:long-chain acyl-CoA synthetase|nr:long-chain fatty acid--CoA ligase [Solirubrobacteraceae bacterium]
MTADHTTATTPHATDGPTAAGRARTLAALVIDSAGRHRGTALRYPQAGAWREVSFPALGEGVRQLARGLLALDVQRGERVAILANTRAEWTLADFGAMCAGAVVVPVYQTNSPEECQYVLEHSGATTIFCEDDEQLAKLREIRSELPALRHVIAFTGEHDDALSLEALRERGGEVSEETLDERLGAIAADDLATIVYTSGTTGPPKGCMLTHGQLRATVDMVEERVEVVPGEDVFYVFLPLAHVLTRIVQLIAVDRGAELAYWRGNPKQIVEDVAIVKPTLLPSVPRIFEKIHAAASAKAQAAGGAKLKLFEWAVGVGRAVREHERRDSTPGAALRAQHAIADRLVLSKVRALFGGRIKLAITGAAPIDVDILAFFHAAGVWVLEGYGMSETCAVATLNTIPEHKLGTVGRPLPGCDVRIAEDGEVLMRGPNIFKGYFNDPEATRETLSGDGWLHSGDLGELDDDGYLRITGRKKDLIITSSGKNVSPSNIESSLVQCRWISHAVVFGDRRQYLTALLTLDADEVGALAEKVGASSKDPAQLAEDPAVRAELQSAVDETNRRFARIEQIKRFAVLDRELSQEHEELTPTMKVKRNVVYERHADVFASLYE